MSISHLLTTDEQGNPATDLGLHKAANVSIMPRPSVRPSGEDGEFTFDPTSHAPQFYFGGQWNPFLTAEDIPTIHNDCFQWHLPEPETLIGNEPHQVGMDVGVVYDYAVGFTTSSNGSAICNRDGLYTITCQVTFTDTEPLTGLAYGAWVFALQNGEVELANGGNYYSSAPGLEYSTASVSLTLPLFAGEVLTMWSYFGYDGVDEISVYGGPVDIPDNFGRNTFMSVIYYSALPPVVRAAAEESRKKQRVLSQYKDMKARLAERKAKIDQMNSEVKVEPASRPPLSPPRRVHPLPATSTLYHTPPPPNTLKQVPITNYLEGMSPEQLEQLAERLRRRNAESAAMESAAPNSRPRHPIKPLREGVSPIPAVRRPTGPRSSASSQSSEEYTPEHDDEFEVVGSQ